MAIQGVILDLDGLMVDSEPLAKLAWQTLLAPHGHTLDEETSDAMFGLRLKDSSRLVKQRFGLESTVDEIAAEKNRICIELLKANLRPMPGLYDLLRAIGDLGLDHALATSSSADYAMAALQVVGLEGEFATAISGDMVANGKPAPDIYLAAARALSLRPAACLALEDSPVGVQAAKAAGLYCVAVPNSLTARLDLSAADLILPSLTAVAERLADVVGR